MNAKLVLETRRAAIVRRLTAEGWILERHGANYDVYIHATLPSPAIVPRHRTLTIGVARSIAAAADW